MTTAHSTTCHSRENHLQAAHNIDQCYLAPRDMVNNKVMRRYQGSSKLKEVG